MSRISNIDWYRHLSFAAVGGFFAAYAILLRMGIMANAQTLNLLDMLLNSFEGDWLGVLMHIGALVILYCGHHVHGVPASPIRLGYAAGQPSSGCALRRCVGVSPGGNTYYTCSLPHFLCHERPMELLLRSAGKRQLHHLFHQQHQAGCPLPGPSSVRPGKGTAAADVVLCFHHSQLPYRRCVSLLRCGALGDQGFSVCAPFHPLGLLHGGL